MKSINGISSMVTRIDATKKRKTLVGKLEIVAYRVYANAQVYSEVVPATAAFAVVRAIGPGKSSAGFPLNQTATATAGSFAASIFAVTPGETLTVRVGLVDGYTTANFPGYSGVAQAGVDRVKADGGGGSASIGDVVLLGDNGSIGSKVIIGGSQYGDLYDNYSRNIVGLGVQVDAETGAILKDAGPGGGAAAWYGNGQYRSWRGGDGIVSIEYYNGDPR